MVASWYNEQDSKRETNGDRFECGTLRTWSAVQLWAKVVVLYDIVIVHCHDTLSSVTNMCVTVPVYYNP